MNKLRFSPWLLSAALLMLISNTYADLTSDLLTLTGGKDVKCVYYQKTSTRIKTFSTIEGVERDLLGANVTAQVQDFGAVKIDKSGTYVAYTDMANAGATRGQGDVYRIKYDGTEKTLLKSGYGWMAELWNDSITNTEWVFTVKSSGDYLNEEVYKFKLDGTTTTPIKVCNWKGDWNLSVSGNGKYLAGDLPWPNPAVTDISTSANTVSFLEGLTGCTSAISPDNQYYFTVLDNMGQNHKTIHVYRDIANNKVKLASIPVDTRFDQNGAIGFMQWTNHPLFFWCGQPALDAKIPDFVVCRYAADYKSIEAYVRVTQTPAIDESVGDAWIRPVNILTPTPNNLNFQMNETGSAPTSQTVTVARSDGAAVSGLTATSSQSWLTASLSGTTVTNTVAKGSLTSGLYTALVSLKLNNAISGSYAVSFHINGTPAVSRIILAPDSSTILESESVQLTASIRDQFGDAITGTVVWTVSGGGAISSSGLFTSTGTPGVYSAIGTIGTIKDTVKIAVLSHVQPLPRTAVSAMLQLQSSVDGSPYIMYGQGGNTRLLPGETVGGNTHEPYNGKQVTIGSSVYKWTATTSATWGTDQSKEYFITYYAINIISLTNQTVLLRLQADDWGYAWMNGDTLSLGTNMWNLTKPITMTAGVKYKFIFKHLENTGGNSFNVAFRTSGGDDMAADLSYELPYNTTVIPDNGFTVTANVSGKTYATGASVPLTWTMDATRTSVGADIYVSPGANQWYIINDATLPMSGLNGSYAWTVSDSATDGDGNSVYIAGQPLKLKIVGYNQPDLYGYAQGTFTITPRGTAATANLLLPSGKLSVAMIPGSIAIKLPDLAATYQIKIRDILGRTIVSRTVKGEQKVLINNQSISAGVVYVSISDDRSTVVKKLINIR